MPGTSIGRGRWRLRRNGCVRGWLLEEMNVKLTKLPKLIHSLQPGEMEPGEGEKTCAKVLMSCVAGEVVWAGGT